MQYMKNMLDKLVEQQVAAKEIDNESAHVLQSMLKFAEKDVALIMTNLEHVFCLDVTDVLDFEKPKAIYSRAHADLRLPDHLRQHRRVFFAKDLILIDPTTKSPSPPSCRSARACSTPSTSRRGQPHAPRDADVPRPPTVTGRAPPPSARTTSCGPPRPSPTTRARRGGSSRVNGVVGIVTWKTSSRS